MSTSVKSALKRSVLWSMLRSFRDQLLILNWALRRPPLPATSELRLHLGCGDIDAPGFINIDGRPMPHVHRVQRIDWLKEFKDDSVTLVYASHCLEHFPHAELPRVLKEWCRVVKPGGVVRISVPDFDTMVRMYLDQGRDIKAIQQPLMGEQNYPFNFHFAALNETHLMDLLKAAGCSEVRLWTPGGSLETSMPDWSGRPIVLGDRRYAISLNIEGVK